MKIYPIFHASFLEPVVEDLLPEQISLPPSQVEIDREEDTVQEVLDSWEYGRW